MKRRILLLMMTALLSVGAWATDDLTLNVGEASGSWGVTNTDGSMTIQQNASSGWTVNLSQDEYCGIEVEYSTSTPRIYLQIWYEGDTENPSQSIELSTSATTLKTYFSHTGTIKEIVFKYGEWEGSPSDASITITSAVVKAYDSDKDFTLNMTYAKNFNEWGWGTFNVSGNTIEVGQYAEGGWSVSLNKDKYCGVDFSFTATTAKIYLKIVYADATEQSIEIPAGSNHIAADFIQNANISKIGFKHGDDQNSNDVSITITSAVVKAESTGEVTELAFADLGGDEHDNENKSFTLAHYNWTHYWSFDPAINSDDYEKIVVTFAEAVPQYDLSINAKVTSDGSWNGTNIGNITKDATKATAYFSTLSSASITQVGFYFGKYDVDETTLKIASAKLIKKPTQSITIGSMTHGTVTASVTEAWEGKTVILTPVPNGNYEISGAPTVTDANSASVTVTDNGDGTYSFTMPATAVTVSATFTEKTLVKGETPTEDTNDVLTEVYTLGTQTLTVSVEKTEDSGNSGTYNTNGTISASATTTDDGTTITLTPTPADGYKLSKLIVEKFTEANIAQAPALAPRRADSPGVGNYVATTKVGNNYTFTMQDQDAYVTVTALFAQKTLEPTLAYDKANRTVTITNTAGSAGTLHYKLNSGDEQTTTDASASKVIKVNTTVKAWIVSTETGSSENVEETFSVAAKPTVAYTDGDNTVSLSLTPATSTNTADATLYYTTDGNDPTTDSTQPTADGTIDITEDMTIKVLALDAEGNYSEIVEQTTV